MTPKKHPSRIETAKHVQKFVSGSPIFARNGKASIIEAETKFVVVMRTV